jgi:hypothetical protein
MPSGAVQVETSGTRTMAAVRDLMVDRRMAALTLFPLIGCTAFGTGGVLRFGPLYGRQ